MPADLLITIACVVTGCLIGGWLARVVGWSCSSPRHECSPTPIAVDHQTSGVFGPAKTVVLWRCPGCSTVETTALDGRFTLAQVQGENEQEEVPGGRS